MTLRQLQDVHKAEIKIRQNSSKKMYALYVFDGNKEKLRDLSKKSSSFYEIVKQILRHLSDLYRGEAYFHEII